MNCYLVARIGESLANPQPIGAVDYFVQGRHVRTFLLSIGIAIQVSGKLCEFDYCHRCQQLRYCKMASQLF